MHWKRRLVAAVVTLSLIAGLIVAAPAGFGQAGSAPPGFGQDLFQIHLAPASFDPLTTVPNVHRSLDLTGYGEHERGLYVVQWKGPIYGEQKQIVAATGAELGDYLPHFAFLARMTEAERSRVEDLPFIRSVVPYKPAFKLAPELLAADGQVVSSFMDADTVTVQVAGFDEFEAVTNAIGAANGTVLEQHGGLVIAEVPLTHVADLAHSTAVTSIAPVPKFQLFNDKAAGVIGSDAALATGLDGAGQIVGVADTGLDTGRTDTMHQDLRGRVSQIFALGRQGDASDTHGHGTHVAGSIAGNGAASNGQIKGMAPGARIVFQSVMDARGALSGIGDVGTLLRQAYNAGARIHSNSWGDPNSNGVYDASSMQLDRFVWQNRDMTVLMAAGNSGSQGARTAYGTVSSPGTAKNAITIGASENVRPDRGQHADRATDIASFSSRGWTRDNRVKPDLVAPGTWILSMKSSRASVSSFWAPYNDSYAFMGGTSMATPIAAGTVAQLRQYYTEHLGVANPSASLLKATLINGATDLGHGLPSRDQGWGRINLAPLADAVKAKQPSWQFENERHALVTGQSQTYTVEAKAGQPLRVTLVWTDYPASANAAKALVNDLDLTLTSPSGKTYYGNDFTSRGTADRANNVENVFIANPEAGTWTITVNAFSVPNGPQHYSLVYTGGTAGGAPPPPQDKQAPSVSITAPATGATVKGNVDVTVQATDNVGVTKVELLVDGNVVDERTSAPYQFQWNSAAVANGRHELTAKAYDAAGNVGTSQAVTVTVNNGSTEPGPDPNPDPDPDPTPEPEPGRIEKTATDTVGWFMSRYYSVDIPAAGRFDLNLKWDGASDLDLYVMDSNGRLLGQATNSQGQSESISVNVQPGRYYVRVQSYYGSTQFRLTVSYPAAGDPGQPGEPGRPGQPGTPNTEERNGVLQANQRVDVPVQLTNQGSLKADLAWTGVSYWGEPSLLVLDANSGRLVATATGRGSPKSLVINALPAGKYVVRVQASRTPIAYRLNVTTTE